MEPEQPPPTRRHVLVQANVAPLDEDGRVAGLVGTLAFAVALLVITIRDGMTAPAADEVPLWIAMCGLGIGLLFLGSCELRGWQRRERAPLVPSGANLAPSGAASQAKRAASPASPSGAGAPDSAD